MQEDQHSLKSGTVLENYTIISILDEDDVGITYLAKDNGLGVKVVIKEYFPYGYSVRTSDGTIVTESKFLDDFEKEKQELEEEAQNLVKFNHPSIVKSLGYFEANNTAYFVMEYEEGIDLATYLKQQNRALTQKEIFNIIMPILEGLKEVHRHDCLFGGINPGNILIRINKDPILIGFAWSKIMGSYSPMRGISKIPTEEYAPLELYSTDLERQGPFSDIYSIGAVMYKMITMKTPIASQTRVYQILQDGKDPLEKLTSMRLKGYDHSFLEAIDKTLELKAIDRQQNIEELLQSFPDNQLSGNIYALLMLAIFIFYIIFVVIN